FGLAFLGVGLLEFRNRRVYASADVPRGLGLNVLGSVPAELDRQTVLAEAVDGIRTQLLHVARQEGRRVVMVTSAIAGEGKTSLSCQLAASLARGGQKTLLIDGDLRHPSVHGRFDLPAQPGFAEALRGESDAVQLVQPTNVDGLAILAAGRCDRSAIQALGRDDAKKLLERLKGDYDFLVVDACPVLPVADALVLGQHVDAVVLAVLRNYSCLPSVYEAQRRLGALDIAMLGAVVLGESNVGYGVERYLAENVS
ncbi:MAG: CpsD/CapB family tyrosine-protein kinase, partial [Gemmataceae bacterium]